MKQLSWTGIPAVLAIAVAVVATFANVFGNSWHYDDLHAITQNPHLQSLQDPLRLLLDPTQFSRDADKAMFRPLLLVSFALNFAWSGLETWSWHLVNLGLHLACTLVLWQILRDLGRPPAHALWGALLFALHPLATEPVNYISSRSESLAALFVLGAFCLHLRATEAGGRQDWRWRAGSVLAFALGVMTKSVAITTPALLLAFTGLRYGWRRALTPATWWPYAAIAVAYLAIVGAHVTRAVASDAVRGPWEQLATQAKALPYYARLLAFPVGLNVHHQFFAGGAALVVALSVAAVISLLYVGLRRAPRDVTFGLLWVAMILSPTIVVPLHVLVNDHRLYLPMVGVVLALTSLTSMWGPRQRPWLGPVGLVLLGVLAVTSWQRNSIWQNEFTLWSDAAAKSPTPLVPVAYVHLGNYAKDAGHLAEAEGYFRHALSIDPDHVAARNNLGITLQGLGRWDEAVVLYQGIVTERPDLAEGWYNLGKAYQQSAQAHRIAGEEEAALAEEGRARASYRRAPLDGPHAHVILNNLGTTFENTGRLDSATIYYRLSLESQMTNADARRNLTRLLRNLPARASMWMEAGAFVELESLCAELIPAAERLGYKNPGPLFFLAVSRFSQGLYAESVPPNRQLVAQYPDFAEGYLQLGNVYETLGDPVLAADVYRQQLLRLPGGERSAEASTRLQRLEARR